LKNTYPRPGRQGNENPPRDGRIPARSAEESGWKAIADASLQRKVIASDVVFVLQSRWRLAASRGESVRRGKWEPFRIPTG